ncbi:MAG: Bug family tripartite tricarboxylate transporter substrate binding protein [Gemmatimonas sp.]
MRHVIGAALALCAAVVAEASAQTPEAFFRGKALTMLVGFDAGSGYDLYGRLVARHYADHIPGNPKIVVQNKPGATSLIAAEYLYNQAPRDGTTMLAMGRNILTEVILEEREAGKGMPPKQILEFNWIGNANKEASICYTWATTGVRTIEDATRKPLKFGSTGPGSDYESFARVLDVALGTRFETIRGYSGPGAVQAAIERGELDGVCGVSWSSFVAATPTWIAEKKVYVLAQLNLEPHPDLKGVPVVLDLAKSPDDRAAMRVVFARQAIGRPFVAPPGVPAERMAVLRAAFDATVKDRAFLDEAAKARIEINPSTGAEMEDLLKQVYATPEPIVKRAAAMIRGN